MKPLIRFKEFNSDWQEKKLGEISTFLDSTRKPIKESDRAKMKGEFPYYGASGIIDYVNDYIFDDEIILLGEDGENIISRNLPLAFRVSGKCWVNNHAHVIKPFDNIDIDFLAHSLERISYKEFNSGTAQPKLNQEVCKSIPLYIPHQSEQKKIASFLSAVDEKITQLTKKIELLTQYKKGVMQKIFSQELRFRANDGSNYPDWKKISISKIASFIKDGTHGTHIDSSDGEYYLLSAKNIINGRVIYGESDRRISKVEFDSIYSNYSLEDGDVLLSVVGTIGRVAIYIPEYKNMAFQRSVAFFRFPNQSSIFMAQLFSSREFQKSLLINQVVSAQPGIYLGDLGKIKVNIPCLEEQAKIANLLLAIDDKVQNIQSQLKATKQYKQGLLQQMFV